MGSAQAEFSVECGVQGTKEVRYSNSECNDGNHVGTSAVKGCNRSA